MSDWRLTHIPEPALAFGFGQTAESPERWALPLRPTCVEPEPRAHGRGGHRYRARDRAVRALGEIDRDHDHRSGEGQARE